MNKYDALLNKKSPLFLIVWNKLDFFEHGQCLNIIRKLLLSKYQNCILPLLRPAGRSKNYYKKLIKKEKLKFYTNKTNNIKYLLEPKLPCEIWINITKSNQTEIIEVIKQQLFEQRIDSALIIGPLPYSEWSPLSNKFESCVYTSFGQGFSTLYNIKKHKLPWVLKLIWYRGTKYLLQNVTDININNKTQIKKIITEITKPFYLSEYGLGKDKIDPINIGTIHLALFAVNAFIPVQIKYLYTLEDYFNKYITRPYLRENKQKYFKKLFEKDIK